MIPFYNVASALRSHKSIEVVSFDVFDTVIFRRQGSWDSFLQSLGEHLRDRGLVASDITPEQFVALRHSAENSAHTAAARKRNVRAVPLTEIYKSFARDALTKRATPELLATIEFEWERASAYTIPTTIALMKRLLEMGKRICFTSNTYYGRDQLTQVLNGAGVPESCLTYVFCSSDFGRGKQHGLFTDVLGELCISPHNLLHCGDKASVDVKVPAGLGIEVSHYTSTAQLWLSDVGEDSSTIASVISGSNRFNPDTHPFEDFGYTVLGPMIVGFTSWLLSRSLEWERPRLFFAEREGVFLKSVTDYLLAHSSEASHRKITTELIAISRSAVAPLTRGKTHALDLQTDLANRRSESFDTAPWDDYAAPTAERARRYLTEVLAAPAESLFVDVGYKGTIGHVLNEFIFNEAGASLLGAYFIVARDADRVTSPMVGYLPGPDDSEDILKRSMKGVSFIEQCLMPAVGSVVGYDSMLQPLRDEFVIPRQQILEQNSVQRGIMQFAEDVATTCAELGLPLSATPSARATHTENLINLLTKPARRVEDLASHWKHEVNFGSRELINVSAKPTANDLDPSLGLLLSGKSWIGPLRRDMPLGLSNPRVSKSAVEVVCSTERGPIGPGKIVDSYVRDGWRVSSLLTAPIGESFRTLRLSAPQPTPSVIDVTLIVSARGTDAPTAMETLGQDVQAPRIRLKWSKSHCQVTSDPHRLVRRYRSEDGGLYVLFDPQLESNSILLLLSADLPPAPVSQATPRSPHASRSLRLAVAQPTSTSALRAAAKRLIPLRVRDLVRPLVVAYERRGQ